MINENDNEQRIKDKVNFFIDEQVKVHVKLKDKTFLNGIILKKLREDPSNVYWFKDNKFGEVYLFLKDIYDLEEMKI